MTAAFHSQVRDSVVLRADDAAEIAPYRALLAATAAKPADDGAPVSAGALVKIIERIEDLVDQETSALKSHAAIDLKDFNGRKSHGLLELSRVLRQYQGTTPNHAILSRLAGLRAKLETNRAVLKLHLEAVREISTIVSEAIQEAESDGTYSIPAGAKRKLP